MLLTKLLRSTTLMEWTSSAFYPPLIRKLLKPYAEFLHFDLVLSWEYPNDQGIGCNVISPDDTANFLAFLKQLRSTLKKDALITAATSIKPFMDSTGNPVCHIALKLTLTINTKVLCTSLVPERGRICPVPLLD